MFTAHYRSLCLLLITGSCVYCSLQVLVFTAHYRSLCLLLITGPCVTVVLNFDNFRVMHNYKHIGEM